MKYIIDIPEKFKYTVEMGITQNGSIRSKAILNAVKDAIPYKERPHGEWIPHTTIDGYTTHVTCSSCGWNRKAGQYCSLNLDNLPKYCENCGSDNRKKGDPK